MSALSPKQREALEALKEIGGESYAYALARTLGRAPGNVSHSLRELEAKGMVVRSRFHSEQGPPRSWFLITEKGHAQLQTQRETTDPEESR